MKKMARVIEGMSGYLIMAGLLVSGMSSGAESKGGVSSTSSTEAPTIENVQGWRIVCKGDKAQRFCDVSSGLKWKSNNHIAVLFEVRSNGAGTPMGQLTVPFGVDLPAGAKLQIDGRATWPSMGYRTCLPQGCIVPITMDKSMLSTLRVAKTMNVALPLINGGRTEFNLTFSGFDAAYARMEVLARNNG